MTLYLASQSPRRKALVNLLGIKRIEIRPSPVEEVFDYTESPQSIVQDLAYQKAEASFKTFSDSDAPGIIVGADTIVVLGDKILGKPVDKKAAAAMLHSLSNKTHTVLTGIALIDTSSKKSHTFVEQTDVTFRELT